MRRIAVLFALLVFGCNRRATDRENITKPVDTASAKASATVESVPIVVAKPRCDGGMVLAANESGDAGADAAPGSGGSGGIGLGTLGTAGNDYGAIGALSSVFGSGGGGMFPSTVTLKGQTLKTAGLVEDDVEKVVCAAFSSFASCIDAAATGEKDLDGTLGVTWAVGDDGHGAATIAGGTLEDAKLRSCMIDAAKAVTFAKPTAKGATVTYAFDAHRPRKTKQPKMFEVGATIVGRLPPEVVKRIVRANYPRFRACYEQGLKKDPSLEGTVTNKLVIGTTGDVESVVDAGGTLIDKDVHGCVTGVFRTLAFPEPEGGKVNVTYPIDFKNEI